MEQSFSDPKTALTQAVTLSHPLADILIRLTADASDITVRAVLEQEVQREGKLIAFFSRHLCPPERKYRADYGPGNTPLQVFSGGLRSGMHRPQAAHLRLCQGG